MSPRPRKQVVKNQLYFYILEFSVDNVFLDRIKEKTHTKVPLNSIHRKAVIQVAGAKRESSNLVATKEKLSKYEYLRRTGDS